jgi:hypothetical protein
MKTFLLFTLIVLCLQAQAIKKELTAFDKIKINLGAKTIIEKGDKFYVEITSRREKDLEDVEVTVKGNELLISKEKDGKFFQWNWNDNDKYTIKIITKSVKQLKLNSSGSTELFDQDCKELDVSVNGSGDFYTSGKIGNLTLSINGSGDMGLSEITSESIELSVKGSGNIKIDGKAKTVNAEVKGSGDIEGFKLTTDELEASIHGSGNIDMTVNNVVEADIYGSGDIRYKGNPKTVNDNVRGSGDVKKVN